MAKQGIHPQYHTKAKVSCSCGNEFYIGSTQEKIETEICSSCHPLYTGKERGAVKGGRVEKFKQRMEKKSDFKKKSEKRAEKDSKKEKEQEKAK